MIVAIEGQDGIGKTSAINKINSYYKRYSWGQKYPSFSYEGEFFKDADYIKNEIKRNTEVFFTSKSFIERAHAVKNIDFLHYTDKMLTKKTLDINVKSPEIQLYDRYCLSQAVYAKAMMDMLIEELDAKYDDMPDFHFKEYLNEIRFDVGDNFWELPKAKLTIVFIANQEETERRVNMREDKDVVDINSVYQTKVNDLYRNKDFVNLNANSEFSVIVDTTNMTVDDMAGKIEDLVQYYSHLVKSITHD